MSQWIKTSEGWKKTAGNAKSGGGSGGSSDYNDLDNKPKINGIELSGNKSLTNLGALSLDGGQMNNKAIINMSGEHVDIEENFHSFLKLSDEEIQLSYDGDMYNTYTVIRQNGIDIHSGTLNLVYSVFNIISGSVNITPDITFGNDVISKDGTISLRALAETVGQANTLLEEVL